MKGRNDDFAIRLRSVFRIEAEEHAQTIATGLLDLEKNPPADVQQSIVETVFRAAHSLKGAARAADFAEIETICQSLEELFASWKRQESAPSPESFDRAHKALSAVSAALSDAKSPEEAPEERPRAAAVEIPEQRSRSSEETVRISVAKLDARLLEAEEMLTVKLTAGHRARDLRELVRLFQSWRSEWGAVELDARTLRDGVDRRAVPGLARLLDFLNWNEDHLKLLEHRLVALTRTAEQDRHVISKLVDDLLEDSKKLLLLPFSTLAAPFPKFIRDLCRDHGKEAELVIRGDDIAIDKRILEEMKDPLIHLLRNSVDHGIETPEVRESLEKDPVARITLAVSRLNGNKVEIFLSDDGGGIDEEKVKVSAVKQGILSADEARGLEHGEALALIFQADVSTKSIVTKMSGRGLGLAIVREKAEKLGGAVSVESRPKEGTTFRIALPSTLATFRGILIEEAGRMFVVPDTHVERVARVRKDDIRTVEGRETISWDGGTIALVGLAEVLELPRPDTGDKENMHVLIIGSGDLRIAFAVDSVLEEQELLFKRLQKPLSRVRNVSGATVLGSGRVVPILNPTDLLKSARKTGYIRGPAPAGPKATDVQTVLVVEDSITSRMLISSILESAGYVVKTAVDGIEAFTLLRAEHVDLVVSDVEMPRLNGFGLTERIRADKKLSELPVVLVTALETREDRERGIEVGASAYIIKSSFDQSDLLEAVRRLL